MVDIGIRGRNSIQSKMGKTQIASARRVGMHGWLSCFPNPRSNRELARCSFFSLGLLCTSAFTGDGEQTRMCLPSSASPEPRRCRPRVTQRIRIQRLEYDKVLLSEREACDRCG